MSIKMAEKGTAHLALDLQKVAEKYPEIVFSNLTQAGLHFKRDVREKTKTLTKKHTGKLLRSFRSETKIIGAGVKRIINEVSGGNGKAPYYYPVEVGHKGKVPVKKYETKEIGFVEGRHMMKKTIEEWENEEMLLKYADMAVEEALKKGGF